MHGTIGKDEQEIVRLLRLAHTVAVREEAPFLVYLIAMALREAQGGLQPEELVAERRVYSS